MAMTYGLGIPEEIIMRISMSISLLLRLSIGISGMEFDNDKFERCYLEFFLIGDVVFCFLQLA